MVSVNKSCSYDKYSCSLETYLSYRDDCYLVYTGLVM